MQIQDRNELPKVDHRVLPPASRGSRSKSWAAVAHALADTPCRPRDPRTLAPDAAKILQGNVYGWFERIELGLYGLTSSGRVALVTWADHVSAELAPVLAQAPDPERTV